MDAKNLVWRTLLAERLRGLGPVVAERVTEGFLRTHPDWVERYGDLARRRGVEDAVFHVQFLASAVQVGDAGAFADYARWTRQVLEARGIAVSFLAENLRQVAGELAGMLDGEEAAVVRECFEAADAVCAPDAPPVRTHADMPSHATTVFVQALLSGNRRPAWNIVQEQMRMGTALPVIYTDLLQHAMYEVGRLWEGNVITVAQEHVATAIVQFIVAQLYPLLPQPDELLGRMVLAGVEGEMHQVGANMVADIMEADGWDVRFLGINVPEAAAVKAVRDHQADLVGISATMLFNVPRVQSLIAAVRGADLDPAPRILVGGAAFRARPGLAQELGADGLAGDLNEACRVARRLLAAGSN